MKLVMRKEQELMQISAHLIMFLQTRLLAQKFQLTILTFWNNLILPINGKKMKMVPG